VDFRKRKPKWLLDTLKEVESIGISKKTGIGTGSPGSVGRSMRAYFG
jgi:hypothetical protein